MADFDIAHAKSMGNEGGYANNPADTGGETYMGVARNFHPKWQGWRHVDATKANMTQMPTYGTNSYFAWARQLNRTAAANPALQKLVIDLYESVYWRGNRLGEIDNQDVANQIYDWAVNTGSRGNTWIQEALGVTADGVIGPKTLKAINTADPVVLLTNARKFAKEHRLKMCEDHPSQKQFLAGWLRRDGFSVDEIQGLIA